jgi:hypothetical protein
MRPGRLYSRCYSRVRIVRLCSARDRYPDAPGVVDGMRMRDCGASDWSAAEGYGRARWQR